MAASRCAVVPHGDGQRCRRQAPSALQRADTTGSASESALVKVTGVEDLFPRLCEALPPQQPFRVSKDLLEWQQACVRVSCLA